MFLIISVALLFQCQWMTANGYLGFICNKVVKRGFHSRLTLACSCKTLFNDFLLKFCHVWEVQWQTVRILPRRTELCFISWAITLRCCFPEQPAAASAVFSTMIWTLSVNLGPLWCSCSCSPIFLTRLVTIQAPNLPTREGNVSSELARHITQSQSHYRLQTLDLFVNCSF